MTYRWLTDLDVALEAGGVPYTPVGRSTLDPTGAADWRTRGRPTSTGQHDPSGVLCHHTASPNTASAQADLNVILRGNSEAPGPISHLLLSRPPCELFLVAAGRCNHAGTGSMPWFNGGACTDGNARLIGLEVAADGSSYWPDEQTDFYGRTVAALIDYYGWGLDRVLLHATITRPCPVGNKIDPSGPWQSEPSLPALGTWNLDTWRAFVSGWQGGTPIPDPEDDDVWYGPYLIQGTGADGTQNGRVYATDGRMMTLRWLSTPEALAGYRWTMRENGASAPELADNGPLLAVDTIGAYGVVLNPNGP